MFKNTNTFKYMFRVEFVFLLLNYKGVIAIEKKAFLWILQILTNLIKNQNL